MRRLLLIGLALRGGPPARSACDPSLILPAKVGFGSVYVVAAGSSRLLMETLNSLTDTYYLQEHPLVDVAWARC